MDKVLVVDDDIPILRIIRIALKRIGYEVLTARNGVEAVKVLEKEKPALIITDVLMPQIGGFELLNILKNNEQWKDIPVIVLTSLSKYGDIQRSYEKGADFYLSKPFKVETLIKAVRSVLQSKEDK